MNDLQQKALVPRLADATIDSTKVLPDCCNEHTRQGWNEIHLFFIDVKDDLGYGKDVARYQNMN